MGLLSKLGMYTKGNYLFTKINKNTVVLLGAKPKGGDAAVLKIPEKLGSFTVRGIDAVFNAVRSEKQAGLSDKQRIRLSAKLRSFMPICHYSSVVFTNALEYIGSLPEGKKASSAKDSEQSKYSLILPKNVTYIENCSMNVKCLFLPRDIELVGKAVNPLQLEEVCAKEEARDPEVPHATVNEYRGYTKDGTKSGTYASEKELLQKRRIMSEAFDGCKGLKKVLLPEGIEQIDDAAFRNCGSVERFCFPKSLTDISPDAFSGTVLTDSIHYPSDLPVRIPTENYNLRLAGKLILESQEHLGSFINASFANGERITKYASEIDLSCIKGILPDGAFAESEQGQHSDSEKTVYLGHSVTEIGAEAFKNSSITHILLPEGLKAIRKDAFFGCTRLIALRLPESIEIIEEGALKTKKCPAVSLSKSTHEKIKGQKGYLEYLEARQELLKIAQSFILQYKDYFDGKSTENVPTLREMENLWVNNGQHPKLIEKIIDRFVNSTVTKEQRDRYVRYAGIYNMPILAKRIHELYLSKLKESQQLLKSSSPADWLKAYRLDSSCKPAAKKIVSYLLDICKNEWYPSSFRNYIDSYMYEVRDPSSALTDSFYGKSSLFKPSVIFTLDGYYREIFKESCSYFKIITTINSLPIGTKSPIKHLVKIREDLPEQLEKDRDKGSLYVSFWQQLINDFDPSCKYSERKWRQKKPTSSAHNSLGTLLHDIDLPQLDSTPTHSSSSDSEETGFRFPEIVSEWEAQKRAERFVRAVEEDMIGIHHGGYVGDIWGDEIPDIDWSEWGDV